MSLTSLGPQVEGFLVGRCCCEYICADEVGDCTLRTVSIDGAYILSVKYSCGDSVDCYVFGGLSFHVV